MKLGVQFAFDILSSEGCESDSFFSKIHRKVSRIFNFQFRIFTIVLFLIWFEEKEMNKTRSDWSKNRVKDVRVTVSFRFFFHFKVSRISKSQIPNSVNSKQSERVLFGLMNRQQQMNNTRLDCCKIFCENLEFVKLCGDQLIFNIFSSYTILQKVFFDCQL